VPANPLATVAAAAAKSEVAGGGKEEDEEEEGEEEEGSVEVEPLWWKSSGSSWKGREGGREGGEGLK